MAASCRVSGVPEHRSTIGPIPIVSLGAAEAWTGMKDPDGPDAVPAGERCSVHGSSSTTRYQVHNRQTGRPPPPHNLVACWAASPGSPGRSPRERGASTSKRNSEPPIAAWSSPRRVSRSHGPDRGPDRGGQGTQAMDPAQQLFRETRRRGGGAPYHRLRGPDLRMLAAGIADEVGALSRAGRRAALAPASASPLVKQRKAIASGDLGRCV